jgi:hypothetical protein
MKTVTDHLRASLLSQLPSLDPLPVPVSLEYVLSRQTLVEQFESLRRNRLAFGFFRYRHNFHSGERGHYNSVDGAIDRLKRYLKDGNQEHLVDAANLCMVEFVQPACHPNPHFSPTDDGEHVEIAKPQPNTL